MGFGYAQKERIYGNRCVFALPVCELKKLIYKEGFSLK